MLLAILSICSAEDEEGESDDEDRTSLAEIAAENEIIRSKVTAVGRMQRTFHILREESEAKSEISESGAELDADSLAVPNAGSTHNFQDAYVKSLVMSVIEN